LVIQSAAGALCNFVIKFLSANGQPTSTEDYGVSDGSLKIWPQADSNGQLSERILVTDGKYYQTYGYFEMEAKLPIGAGAWPAFWLLNSDDIETAVPEIDIMEAYSGDTTGYWADDQKHPIRYNASWFENGPNFEGDRDNHDPATDDLSADFHKYAVKWEPDTVSYYFDGKLVGTSGVSMSKRMYILLDMQYGSASGSADDTTPTGPSNSFEVNYVRSWNFN
jgi:beta-glucanase (GH16 family)